VLVELATPSSAGADDVPAPLRLKRLVIGASDVRRASDVLRSHFGLDEVAMNDVAHDAGGRSRRGAGGAGRGSRGHRGPGGALDDREDFHALTDAFTRAGTSFLRAPAK